MNSIKFQRKVRAPHLKVVENPVAEVLEAEKANRFCREETYFDAIKFVCTNFEQTPLLTTGKVFINFARKYVEDGQKNKALEILDGLAFVLRQLESKSKEFGEFDNQVVHYECLLDVEYARVGEIRFARERVVNRIKELHNRRLEAFVAAANEKCFATLDEIDAAQSEFGTAFHRIKPMLRRLEQSKGGLKPLSAGAAAPKKKRISHYLTGWKPIVLVSVMVLCAIAKGHLIEGVERYVSGAPVAHSSANAH